MRFLKKVALGAVAIACATSVSAAKPKYVFYFIGDGMGLGHVMSTEAYNRVVLGNSEPLLMLQFPVVSVATSYSASTPITDSAAAGTALATGHKTRNGMLGVTPDTTAVNSIAYDLHNQGWGVGIVTSVAPDDATPGAFYAHVPYRSMYYEIGKQAASCGYEFIGGSNWRGTVTKDGKPTDLMEAFAENNVTVVRGADKVKEVETRRVALINTDSINLDNIGYTIDSIPGVLTLPDMTQACLDHLLKNSPDKFFMMVEGGNIDHAGHSDDGGGVIKEILNFQEAIKIAYDFYLAHPDETLIVITADHNTGGMALGNRFHRYTANLKAIDYQKISKDSFSDWCSDMLKSGQTITWPEMEKFLSEKLGFWTNLELTDKQTKYLKEKFEKTFEARDSKDEKTLYKTFSEFAVAVFDTLNDLSGIGFTTTSHTGDFVPVYAIGVDCQRFQGLNDNTDIPKKIYSIIEGK